MKQNILISFFLAFCLSAGVLVVYVSAQAPSLQVQQAAVTVGQTVDFVEPKAGQKISNEDSISIRTDIYGVKQVVLSQINRGYETTIGNAVFDPVSGLWKYIWDTTTVSNGFFSLKAAAVSDTGYRRAIVNVEVQNAPPAVYANQYVFIHIVSPSNGQVVSSNALLAAYSNAPLASVDFILDNPRTADLDLVGRGVLSGSDNGGSTWQFPLDPTHLPNGQYLFWVRGFIDDRQYRSSVYNLTINKGPEPPLSGVSVKSPAAGQAINGRVNLSADVTGNCDRLSFMIFPAAPAPSASGGLSKIERPAKYDVVTGVWESTWDMAGVPNGEYVVSAVASTGRVVLESKSVKVRVQGASSGAADVHALEARGAVSASFQPFYGLYYFMVGVCIVAAVICLAMVLSWVNIRYRRRD